ncbi:MAG TPA: sugar transferase [Myxococcales bacterium]|jgi:exopolysaccharide biosynthesis polyprenyl glycosylphosphotransferase
MASGLGRVAPGAFSKVNLAIDLALLVLSFWIALSATGGVPVHLPLLIIGAGVVAWVLAGTALRHYDPLAVRALFDDLAMVGVLVLSQVTILAAFALTPEINLAAIGWFVAFELPLASVARIGLRPLLAREGPVEDVLVIGVGPLGRATAADIDRHKRRQHVVGHLELPGESAPPDFQGRPLGTSADLSRILSALPVDEVYLAGNPARHGEAMQSAIKVCETLGVPFALPQYSFRFDRAVPVDARQSADGYNHFISMEPKPAQLALKRLFDIVVSGTALWLLLPLLVGVAALVKLSSRGPIFFKQVRVGRFGRPFHMLKFRSMVVDAEQLRERLEALNEQKGPVFKIALDPRVTPLGRFLRKHSIDELPQIINVLRGDMSIVGPRPPIPTEVAKYQAWQRRRLSVRPGLTCIWQVSGRSQISFDDWMYLDMRYIDHWNLGEDVKLVLKTFPVVVNGRGAA